MNILLTSNVRWWNAEAAYAWEKGLGLQMRGHRVSFLGLPGSPIVEKADREGFPVYPTDGLNSTNPLTWPGTVRRLREFIRRRSFHVVDAHRSEGFALLALAVRRTDAALVRTRGDMRRPRRDPLNRFVHVYLCDALVASGTVVAEKMADAFDLPLSRIEVVYYGVDAVHFTPGYGEQLRREWGAGADDFLVGAIGRVDRVKGLAYFLQAASRAGRGRDRVRFVVAVKEDHPDLVAYKNMIDKLNLSDQVVLLGFCPDIEKVYRALDAVVVASVGSEANCRVTLEAMASGRPVIATTAGVIPEVLRDGDAGYLVDPGQVGPLEEAIVELVDNPEAAKEMGRRGRSIVEEKFTRQILAQETERIYRRVLEGSRE